MASKDEPTRAVGGFVAYAGKCKHCGKVHPGRDLKGCPGFEPCTDVKWLGDTKEKRKEFVAKFEDIPHILLITSWKTAMQSMIFGKVEKKDKNSCLVCMKREFEEETGILADAGRLQWNYLGKIDGAGTNYFVAYVESLTEMKRLRQEAFKAENYANEAYGVNVIPICTDSAGNHWPTYMATAAMRGPFNKGGEMKTGIYEMMWALKKSGVLTTDQVKNMYDRAVRVWSRTTCGPRWKMKAPYEYCEAKWKKALIDQKEKLAGGGGGGGGAATQDAVSEAATATASTKRLDGVVTHWNWRRSFGFITPRATDKKKEDIYFHITELRQGTPKPRKGYKVSFVISDDPRDSGKICAKDVIVLERSRGEERSPGGASWREPRADRNRTS